MHCWRPARRSWRSRRPRSKRRACRNLPTALSSRFLAVNFGHDSGSVACRPSRLTFETGHRQLCLVSRPVFTARGSRSGYARAPVARGEREVSAA